MLSQVLAHQHSAPLEWAEMKENCTDLYKELAAENSTWKNCIGNFCSNASIFLPDNPELSQCSMPACCYQQVTDLLAFLLPWKQEDRHGLCYLREAALQLLSSCSPAAPQGLGQAIQTGTIPTPPGPSWAPEGPTCQNFSSIPSSAFGIIPPANQPGPTESHS